LAAPKQQSTPPRESSTEEDAETRPEANPNGVVREGEKDDAEADPKDQAYSSGDGFPGLKVLLTSHAATLHASDMLEL
jgi:hypothetical protein